MVGAAEHLRVPVRPLLDHRETGIDRLPVGARFGREDLVHIMQAQARAAMAADVVVRLHRARLIADDDDAVAMAVLEDEVVAGLRNPVFVIGHQPELLGDEPFVVDKVLLIDVVGGGNRGAFAPPAGIGLRGLAGRRERRLQRDVAAIGTQAAVGHLGRHGEASTPRHRGAFGRCRSRPLQRFFAAEHHGRERHRGCSRGHRRACEVTAADLFGLAQLVPPGCWLLVASWVVIRLSPWSVNHRRNQVSSCRDLSLDRSPFPSARRSPIGSAGPRRGDVWLR